MVFLCFGYLRGRRTQKGQGRATEATRKSDGHAFSNYSYHGGCEPATIELLIGPPAVCSVRQ